MTFIVFQGPGSPPGTYTFCTSRWAQDVYFIDVDTTLYKRYVTAGLLFVPENRF